MICFRNMVASSLKMTKLIKQASIIIRPISWKYSNNKKVDYEQHQSNSSKAGDNFHAKKSFMNSIQVDKVNHLYEKRLKEIQQTITNDYWEKIFEKIQLPAKLLIQNLMNPKTSKKQYIRQLQAYLEFRNLTFEQSLRTDTGCMAVLVAICVYHQDSIMEEYQSRIIDFVCLTDLDSSKYDSFMLHCLIKTTYKRIGMNIQKNIRQYYRLKYVQIILGNLQILDPRDQIIIICHINDSILKDHNNFITKWRFYELYNAILAKSIKSMQQCLHTQDKSKRKAIQKVMNFQYLERLSYAFYNYNHLEKEQALTFYEYFKQMDEYKRQDLFTLRMLLQIATKIPYVELNEKGQTIRQRIYTDFQSKYSSSPTYRSSFASLSLSFRRYFIQTIMLDNFFRAFKSISFENINQKYHILRSSALPEKPKINTFILRLYKQDQQRYLQKFIFNDVMYTIYPEKISQKYIENKVSINLKYSDTQHADNEANYRVWEALDALGVKYKKQTVIHQRSVDILIDEDIIMEIDGQLHYNPFARELQPATGFRNYHLLLSGYKMIIISMFEYNTNRSTQKMSQLIKEKLDLVRQEGIIYVA